MSETFTVVLTSIPVAGFSIVISFVTYFAILELFLD